MFLALCFLFSILMCAYGAVKVIFLDRKGELQDGNVSSERACIVFLVGLVCNLALSAYYVVIQFLEVLI